MGSDTVDAARYVGDAAFGLDWRQLSERVEIYAYRGRFVGFIRVSAPEACKPWCGVCQRPVDRCAVGVVSPGYTLTNSEVFSVARATAFCHGRVQVVDAPWGRVRSGQRFELGVAFWDGPQPRAAT